MKLANFLLKKKQSSNSLSILQLFLQEKAATTTTANAEHLFESLYPLLKAHPNLKSITYNDLQQTRLDMRNQYATGSIRSKLIDYRTFFKWCLMRGYVDHNVAKGLTLPRVRPRDRAADDHDVQAVLRHLAKKLDNVVIRNFFGRLEIIAGAKWNKWQQHAARDLFMLTFIYETGARAGEVANLLTADINKALQQPRGPDGRVFAVELFGKTDERVRAFTTATAELWLIWQQVRPKKGAKNSALVKWQKKDELAEALTSQDVSHILVRRCDQAGVKTFRSHALRHGKAKRAKQYGGVEVAMALLDHNNITSTLFYTLDDDRQLNEAALKTGQKRDPFGYGRTLD